MRSWGRAASSPAMPRLTRSWRAILRKSYGISPLHPGHPMSPMSMNPVSLPTTSTNNPSIVNFGVRRRRTDRSAYGELGQRPADLIRMAVIGYGYWGPNLVRNLHNLDNCDVVAVCDKSQAALKSACRMYPGI